MNSQLAHQVLQALVDQGVRECCVCAGARNAPFVYLLAAQSLIKIYYWPEERSAAFFAIGRIKATQHPVAVFTTSGTAAGELLPAAMEAHYTGLPLILVTADRPRRFRGVGAPQAAEQVGLFGIYAHHMQDLAAEEVCHLDEWKQQGPLHLNVCFEEPNQHECQKSSKEWHRKKHIATSFVFPDSYPQPSFEAFIASVSHPLVIVGALKLEHRESVIQFLLHLQAPVYAEAISGIREDPRIKSLRIVFIPHLWQQSSHYHYAINGILRIGGMPTARLWRDIEKLEGAIPVCSVSEHPFPGLSWGTIIQTDLNKFFKEACLFPLNYSYPYQEWLQANGDSYNQFIDLLQTEPHSEQGLIYQLSQKIPMQAKIYLGNSLPIREWDQAATYQVRNFQIAANRGLNGIDGQFSTFLGYCSQEQDNWAILGDLTTLFDLVAPWIASQLPAIQANCVIINNGGGKIFAPMFSHPAFLNSHTLCFEPLAQLWGWNYERWDTIPLTISQSSQNRLIEIVPHEQATQKVLKKIQTF